MSDFLYIREIVTWDRIIEYPAGVMRVFHKVCSLTHVS